MPNGKPLNFKKTLQSLFWLIPAGVIGHVVFSLLKTDPSVFRSLDQFSYEYLILAAILCIFPWFPDALKLMWWTRFLDHPISYKESLSIIISSELGSAISPTAVGGGYVKLGMLIRKGFPAGMAASLMLLGSIEMGVFFSIAVPVSVILSRAYDLPLFHQIRDQFFSHIKPVPGMIILTVLIFILVMILFVLPHVHWGNSIHWVCRLRERIVKFRRDFMVIYQLIGIRGKKQFGLNLLLTAIQWISRYSVVTALLLFLNLPVQPVLFFLLQWAVFSLGILIPTPGGTVGVETAFYFVYASFIPEGMIGLATSLWRFMTYYFLLILDSIFVSIVHFKIHRSKIKWLGNCLGYLIKI